MDIVQRIIAKQEADHGTVATRRNWPTAAGEYEGICPYHPDRTPGSFAFSERGFNCFSCGTNGSLVKLAKDLGVWDPFAPLLAVPRILVPRAPPAWSQLDPIQAFRPSPPDALAYYHRRGFTDHTLARWQMGHGVLPGWSSASPRLILPVYEDGHLVSLWGRTYRDADTGPKWACAKGSIASLFAAHLLAPGCRLIITEARWDAILVMQARPGWIAVALGGHQWQDEWCAQIAAVHPQIALVWLDNELGGSPNIETLEHATERLRAKRAGMIPASLGVTITNDLLDHGVKAVHYTWPTGTPEGTDLADVAVGA